MPVTIVFLHGFLESSQMWKGFEAVFQEKFNVICLDLPGHGNAPFLGEIHSMELMADYVKEKLNQQKISKAVFIGHSLGGYVALELGKKYPETILGISMFFSSAAADSIQKKKDRNRVASIIQKNAKLFIREAIPYLFAEENKLKLQQKIKEQIELATIIPINGIIACLAGMRDRIDNIAYLNEAPFPVQYIVGQKDPVIPINTLDVQLNSNAVIDIEIIENCGHMGHLENPKQCTKALNRFFKEIIAKKEKLKQT